MLSWQNVFNSRQSAADIEEKLANQGEVLHGGISHIYLSLSSTGSHIISEQHRKITFDFTEIVSNNLQPTLPLG